MPEIVTLATALMLGFLHALEVDHMIAVTAFVTTRPAIRAAARFGLWWGIGHSVAVFALGGLLLLTGLRWPPRYNAIGEALVGVMLVGLGFWAFRASRKLHVHPAEEHGGHAHLHVHGSTSPGSHRRHRSAARHAHPHDAHHPPDRRHHHHAHPHSHGHGVTWVGLLHGLSGTSAVVALVPVTLLHQLGFGLLYLTLFGVGVTLAMALYAMFAALAIGRAAERSVLWGRRVAGLVGLAGIIVGLRWIWTALS